MNPVEMETILKFYMENLPEDKLAELDARLTGDADRDSGAAMDSALAKRKTWAAMDSAQRQSIRRARVEDSRRQAEHRADFEKRFPHANRLGR